LEVRDKSGLSARQAGIGVYMPVIQHAEGAAYAGLLSSRALFSFIKQQF